MCKRRNFNALCVFNHLCGIAQLMIYFSWQTELAACNVFISWNKLDRAHVLFGFLWFIEANSQLKISYTDRKNANHIHLGHRDIFFVIICYTSCTFFTIYLNQQPKFVLLFLSSRKTPSNTSKTSTNLVGNIGLSASSESIYQTKYTRSRGNSTRHHPHRISSRRNKENGSSSGIFRNGKSSNNVKILKSGIENLSKTDSNTLKVNLNHPVEDSDLIESSSNKSRMVSFGETPIIVKMSSKTSVLHIPFSEQQDQTL